ncbi:unnamed protein product [Lactuca virosa]|uniref:Protein-serine/threonine phosphatase n=1 Tax=Lactuca virosa TaxID=75947 RepID=A0AAU9PTY0_9ASTR|nr:unnamed protein product [Lactuca virosa]
MLIDGSLLGIRSKTIVDQTNVADMTHGNEIVLTSIVLKRNVTMLDIVSTHMQGQFGFLAELSSAGGRLVISSDGVWDALSAESALECSRELAPESAAAQIVKRTAWLEIFYMCIPTGVGDMHDV